MNIGKYNFFNEQFSSLVGKKIYGCKCKVTVTEYDNIILPGEQGKTLITEQFKHVLS